MNRGTTIAVSVLLACGGCAPVHIHQYLVHGTFAPEPDFGSIGIRATTVADPHLEYLKVERDGILLSATKHDPSTNEVLGFVWIIDVDSAAEALCRRNPFWEAGLRTSFRLSSLTKTIPEQVATI